MTKSVLGLLILLLCHHVSLAQNIDEQYLHLIKEVRCVTCPNQSIADSNSPVAVSMRNEIQQRLHNRESVDDIKQSLIARYGEKILYDPPQTISTSILWYAPLGFLLVAVGVWYRHQRKSKVLS